MGMGFEEGFRKVTGKKEEEGFGAVKKFCPKT